MKAPFPYIGGKASVADLAWGRLGDVAHYIEPFCGSAAVLLSRPRWHENRVETVNDADGHIANVWRALQAAPDEVAKWCDWPVNHADLCARKVRMNAETESLTKRIIADDAFYDPKLAGYYVWSASCWIGNGMIRPTQRPHVSHGGKGVHAIGKIPHVSDGGKGVHAIGQRPHVSDGGTGVHAIGKRPHVSHSGMGVQEPYNTNIYEWFRKLAERLRYVRVVCGDWSQVCGGSWQANVGTCGMFFDPPYSDVAGRDPGCYAVDSESVAHDVREWCRRRGADSDMRIVLAGYYEEHESLISDGWTVERWSTQGGFANTARQETTVGKENRHKEALFYSPNCLKEETLFPED